MAADLGAAQSDLSTSLIDLRGSPNADPALVSQSEQQLAVIMALKGQLSTASGKQLVAISAQVAAAVSTAAGTARQVQQAAASGISSGSGSLGQASQAARAAVNEFEDAYFKQRKFDPYLEFKSEADKEAFRQREAEREKAIRDAMALHMPEGDLLANKLALDQLNDAGAHGADRSPDLEPMRRRLRASGETLAAAITSAASPPHAADVGAKDVADEVRLAVSVPDSVVAALRAAGAKPADPEGEGHGVSAIKAQGSSVSLGG